MKLTKPLSNGRYSAKCKETSLLAAVAAGHSLVFPKAELIIADGWARFYRGVSYFRCKIWRCALNSPYESTT
ncbi:hypothetical protein D3C72_2464990 [compost metagenome]